MTSSKRLTELAKLDVEAERLVGILEGSMEAIPTLIFLVRISQAQARVELREAGEDALALLGDRHGLAASESAPAVAPRVEEEAEG